ncbi:hypothetical protein [Croceicoccus sp. YJ47]|uniref:hypothetical protein n=1 Tax=Croceicoccus sp. YJ47 TaxID=2798724 RepID=UPI00192464D7|nr:hypothetical protein [Croceicoccus sp. YJ47]QQN73153.1 hypothetical protein JD971_09750 [Croceicoccus sp. YJ47]
MTQEPPTFEDLDAQLDAIRQQAESSHEKAVTMLMHQIRINAGLLEAVRVVAGGGKVSPIEVARIGEAFAKMLKDAEEYVLSSLMRDSDVS